MRRRKLTQILQSANLKVEGEAEVEEQCDVEKVQRNPKLLTQLDGEKSPEEFRNVQGTRLVEIEECQKLPQHQKIRSPLYRGRSEAKHHQRQVRDPLGTS